MADSFFVITKPASVVAEILQGMTLHERLVVCLHYAEGLTLNEIAAVLDAGTRDIERVLERTARRVKAMVGPSSRMKRRPTR